MGMVVDARNRYGDSRNRRFLHYSGGHHWHRAGVGLAAGDKRHRGAGSGFSGRAWSGIFLHLIGGILGILVGLLVVTHPLAGALAWTLLFASFFTVMGIFRVIAAIRLKFPHWQWAVFDGVVTFALGLLLWAEWPWSGLWFIGLAVGISLVLRGWSYVMFAFAIHSLALPGGGQIRQAA